MKRRDTQSDASSEGAPTSAANSSHVHPRLAEGATATAAVTADVITSDAEGEGATAPLPHTGAAPVTRLIRCRRRGCSSASFAATDDDVDPALPIATGEDEDAATSAERRRRAQAQDEAEGNTTTTNIKPRRLHPWRGGHFDRLAAVEVQAIIQMLDTTSLLRLAQCSRRMKSDADSDVAWKMQLPYEVRLEEGFGTLIADRFHRSLMSSHLHAIRICFLGRRIGLLQSDVDAMLTLPHITEMNDEWGLIPTSEWLWLRILRHPAAAGLTSLSIQSKVPQDIISHLVHLPRLHTLEFKVRLSSGPTDVSALPSLLALTSLGVNTLGDLTNPSILAAIAACTRLKQLRLTAVSFRGGEFRRLFTSSNLSRLHRLELSYFDPTQVTAEEYEDAFAALTHLRHLKLQESLDIDSLLSCASRVPHLATVEIVCLAPYPPPPSVAALQALIAHTEATSRMQVTLRLGRYFDSRPFAAVSSHRVTLLTTE